MSINICCRENRVNVKKVISYRKLWVMQCFHVISFSTDVGLSKSHYEYKNVLLNRVSLPNNCINY